MAEEALATTPTEPLGNAETVRNDDGTIKDPAAMASTTQPTETTTEAKPPETKPPEKAEAKPPQEGAPEKYELFKVPDGYELDEEAFKEISEKFKSMNLTQAQAQELVDYYNDLTIKTENAPYEAYDNLRQEWRDTVIKDPQIGNGTDGLKPEVNATIGRAIDSLGPDLAQQFRDAMTLTGAGDNPTFVKAFYNLAQRLGEGTFVAGRGPSPAGQSRSGTPQPASAAAAMYPHLPSSSR